MTAIAERVAAGAAFLDEHDPDWWRADVERAIDLDELDLMRGDSCVLGQRCPLDVHEAYLRHPDIDEDDDGCGGSAYAAYAERLYGTRWNEGPLAGEHLITLADSHGFACIGGDELQFAALTAEWVRVITGRRAAS